MDIIRTPADFSTMTKPYEINEEIAGMYDEAFFADSVLLFIVLETTPEPTYTVTKITQQEKAITVFIEEKKSRFQNDLFLCGYFH